MIRHFNKLLIQNSYYFILVMHVVRLHIQSMRKANHSPIFKQRGFTHVSNTPLIVSNPLYWQIPSIVHAWG